MTCMIEIFWGKKEEGKCSEIHSSMTDPTYDTLWENTTQNYSPKTSSVVLK